jgi:hypothetical protein
MTFNRRTLLCLCVAVPLFAIPTTDIFRDRLNRFNLEMKDFARKLNSHIYDRKQAALLSKLWRDVENSGDWPK